MAKLYRRVFRLSYRRGILEGIAQAESLGAGFEGRSERRAFAGHFRCRFATANRCRGVGRMITWRGGTRMRVPDLLEAALPAGSCQAGSRQA